MLQHSVAQRLRDMPLSQKSLQNSLYAHQGVLAIQILPWTFSQLLQPLVSIATASELLYQPGMKVCVTAWDILVFCLMLSWLDTFSTYPAMLQDSHCCFRHRGFFSISCKSYSIKWAHLILLARPILALRRNVGITFNDSQSPWLWKCNISQISSNLNKRQGRNSLLQILSYWDLPWQPFLLLRPSSLVLQPRHMKFVTTSHSTLLSKRNTKLQYYKFPFEISLGSCSQKTLLNRHVAKSGRAQTERHVYSTLDAILQVLLQVRLISHTWMQLRP